MAGNTFGKAFKISTFGESHGKGLGVIIDGCPAGLPIDEAFIQAELARRRPGQSKIVTQRKEPDTAQIRWPFFLHNSSFIVSHFHYETDYDFFILRTRGLRQGWIYDAFDLLHLRKCLRHATGRSVSELVGIFFSFGALKFYFHSLPQRLF